MSIAERPTLSEGMRRLLVWSAVASLLLMHFVLANRAAWNKSGTFDEASHIANGYSNIVSGGDYRMFPVAILQYRWMTLPLVIKGVPAPKPAPNAENDVWRNNDNYGYGRELLFNNAGDEKKELGMWILRATRMMTSVWSVLTAVVVFLWSRKLFGTAGGFISLALYVFNPTVLAHAAQATVDACAAFFFIASVAALWWAAQRITPGRTLASALVLGGALCAKFSAMLLIPIAFVLVVVRIAVDRPLEIAYFGRTLEIAEKPRRIPFFVGFTLAHVAGAVFVVWALFGFQFRTFGDTPVRPDRANDFQQSTSVLGKGSIEERGNGRDQPGLKGKILRFARNNRLLPEPYLYNFSQQLGDTQFRSAYLDGWYGIAGFPSFFPLCFWYKTPIPTLLVLVLALAGHIVHRRNQIRIEQRRPKELFWNGLYVTLPLWVLLLIYWFTSITSGINIGIRHILPTFPPLFILAGVAADWFRKGYEAPAEAKPLRSARQARVRPEPAETVFAPELIGREPWRQAVNWSLVGLLVLLAANVVWVLPNYLSYFNLFAGGSNNGYTHLVDSSLDWGQDLPALKEWLDEEVLVGETPPKVYMAYFGTTPPSYHGIKPVFLPCYTSREALEPAHRQEIEFNLSEGVYCISATMLQNVYNGAYPGPWQAGYEKQYVELAQFMNQFSGMTPEMRANKLLDIGQQKLNQFPANQREQALAALTEQVRQSPDPALRQMDPLVAIGNQELINYVTIFEWARLGRLCAYLRRHKDPHHIVNNTIFIYNLTSLDLQQALNQTPPPELVPNAAKPGEPVAYQE